MDQRVIFRNPDGTIRMMYFAGSAMRPDQTEDQFIAEQVAVLKAAKADYTNLQHFVIDKADYKSFMNSTPGSHFDKVKIDVNGKLSIDNTVKPVQEAAQETVNSARLKLKGLGFTNEEIIIMVGI